MRLSTQNKPASTSEKVKELCIFAMLGALMFCSKLLMEALPNIHLLGMLTMTYTIAFRRKALIPIYLYVLLNGVFAGFSAWWLPYTYIWTLLWGATMILPQNIPGNLKKIVYPLVCCLHGLAFGTLYAPAQAIVFGLNFEQTIAWIIAGLPYDLIHAVGNFALGLLVLPLSELLIKLSKKQI